MKNRNEFNEKLEELEYAYQEIVDNLQSYDLYQEDDADQELAEHHVQEIKDAITNIKGICGTMEAAL